MIHHFRNKIKNYDYKGHGPILDLAQNQPNAFVFITLQIYVDQIFDIFNGTRDMDVIEERLGILSLKSLLTMKLTGFISLFEGYVPWKYYLTSDQDIPQRMKVKFEAGITSMIENGLIQFFEKIAAFLIEMKRQKLAQAAADDFHAIDITDLKGPLVLCLSLVGLACVVFLFEILIQKLVWRRNNH